MILLPIFDLVVILMQIEIQFYYKHNIMKNQFLLFLLMGMVFFVACGPATESAPDNNPSVEAETPPPAPEKKMTQDAFRDIDFGMSVNEVKSKEGDQPSEEEEGFLLYSHDLNDTEFMDVSYTFAEGALSQISAEIFADNPESAKSHFQKFSSRFNNECVQHGNIWDCETTTGQFSVFAKLLDEKSPGVSVTWEKR